MVNEAIAVALTSAVGAILLAVVNNKHAEELKRMDLQEDVPPAEPVVESLPSLKYHSLFPKIQLLSNKVVLELEMPSQGRQLIARDLLSNKLAICETEYRALAEEHDVRTAGCSKKCAECQWVLNRHMQAVDTIVKACQSYYHNGNYSTEEQGILDLVWTQFNHFHAQRVQLLLASVERTVNSKFYKDCRVQSSIILDQVSAILGETITDAEETFSVINGQLTGRGPFRGVIVDYEKLSEEKGA